MNSKAGLIHHFPNPIHQNGFLQSLIHRAAGILAPAHPLLAFAVTLPGRWNCALTRTRYEPFRMMQKLLGLFSGRYPRGSQDIRMAKQLLACSYICATLSPC